MSKQIPGNQKHMTQDDRITIEKGLDAGISLRQIALSVQKDPSTISKEIKKHRTMQPHRTFNEHPNQCRNALKCKKTNVCDPQTKICKRRCCTCSRCMKKCPDFVPKDYHCPKSDKAPYVCNGCKKKSSCRLDKSYYRATTAWRQYRTILVESRAGINISEEALTLLDETITPLILNGQSPYMILQNHPEIALSEKTIYNYIQTGALSVKNIDLPKKVKYKTRKVHGTEIYDVGIFEGRTYKDYCNWMQEYPDTNVVEMDTVIGCAGSRKVLLTLHFTNCHFMMAFILETKESKYVESIFDQMEDAVSTLMFCKYLPLFLTDRGGEFRHPDTLECGNENIIRTSIYYCDPMCSWQKPHCEKNHEYIRKICPDGTSFDNLTQDDIALIMSHINSANRESLNGLTPFKLATMMLPPELMDFFNLVEVKPDEVNLTPSLLKNR